MDWNITSRPAAGLPRTQGMRQVSRDTAFAQQLQTASVRKTQDRAEISGKSYEQRLSELQKQHEATDYSNMTEAERVRTVYRRFEEAGFPMLAILGGLLGSRTPTDPPGNLRNRIQDTYVQQLEEVSDTHMMNEKRYRLWREVLYPGQSVEEIKTSLAQKYSGGSLIESFSAIAELRNMGIGDSYALGFASMELQKKLEISLKESGNFAALSGDQTARVDQIFKHATSMKIYLSEMVDEIVQNHSPNNPDWLYKELNELVDIFRRGNAG